MKSLSDQPRISIITPSYNQAKYLERTLRSVLEQDYANLEYMVVDGASSDGSVEIIQRLSSRLSWWVSEPDRGQAEAINKGLARASGEIVAWLNSDDYYLPGTLAIVAEAFQQNPEVGLIYGDVLAVDGEDRVINVMHYRDYGLEELMSFEIIGQAGVFMRRSAQQQAGFLDPTFHYLLDHHLWLRIANSTPLKYLRKPLAAARYHPQAKNIAQAARFGQEAYRILEWMQTQPGLAEKLFLLRRRAWAGAYRFDAWYLLEGEQYWQALKVYGRSLQSYPPAALRDWHRMLYAILALAGLGRIKSLYRRLRRAIRSQKEPELYR